MGDRRQVDVVIVGAGMAGLCASLAALEQEARVITLEKGARPGGSMRLSGGVIWTFSSKALLHEEIPDGNHALQDLVVGNLNDGLTWLERLGVPFVSERELMWFGKGRVTNPPDLTAILTDRMRALGGDLMLGTPMDTIQYDDGAVRGVRASGPGGTIDIEAGAVVLATGGFQGNPELLARYVTPYADKVYLRSNPWSTGDGFMAATRVGAAATVGMQAFYGHALPAPPTRFAATEFLDLTQRYGPLAVAINLDGRRFTDESAGTGEEHLNQAIARQREATAVYIVDAEIADMSYFGSVKPTVVIQRVRERNGPVIERGTLEELCTALADYGVTGVKALETLREYTVALTNGTADQLDPPRRKNLFPLVKPPFTAVAVRSGITFTGGGLAVDTDMRVLRRSASCSTLPLVFVESAEANLCPVPNVYAAGCDVGNISDLGYIGGLATALTTGRIAGRAAAVCALSGDQASR